MYVDICSYKGKGETMRLARVSFKDGKISFDGDEKIIEDLKNGISSYKKFGKPILPEDGLEFLEALQDNFKNPYLFATSIIKDYL
jgi:hypothetical protein